jgi:hypothetical protein
MSLPEARVGFLNQTDLLLGQFEALLSMHILEAQKTLVACFQVLFDPDTLSEISVDPSLSSFFKFAT